MLGFAVRSRRRCSLGSMLGYMSLPSTTLSLSKPFKDIVHGLPVSLKSEFLSYLPCAFAFLAPQTLIAEQPDEALGIIIYVVVGGAISECIYHVFIKPGILVGNDREPAPYALGKGYRALVEAERHEGAFGHRQMP